MKKPKVYIDYTVYNKVMYWVNKAKGEVSGLGKVTMENGDFYVHSAYLLKQENTATTTDIDGEDFAKLLYETREEEGDLHWWWHSHVNMGVFWSGTDTKTIEEFGSNGRCVATVFNKKYETKSAVYQGGNEFYVPSFIDDLETEIMYPMQTELESEWDKEFEAKCSDKKYPEITSKYNKFSKVNHVFYDNDDDDDDDDLYDYYSTGKSKAKEGSTILTNMGIESIGITKSLAEITSTLPIEEYEGAIHPQNFNLRFCMEKKDWIHYDDYINEIYYDENALDLLGERPEYIRQFVLFHDRLPLDDCELDDFYMEMTGTNYQEFYFEGVDQ